MDFQDQFENDEIYQQTQNEFLEHMFLMEEASPHFNRGRGPANPNSRSCTCCNGYPEGCSDPVCIGIGMCVCCITENDLAENDDDESLNYVEAQPERKQLSYSSTFTPFVPSSFIPPSPVAVNPNHQYTLSPSEVEKLEKFMEDKKNALGEDIADLYPAIWKLRFHKYGGDASRQNIPWDPELEPKLPLYVTTQIVNPISLYNLPVSVKDQFYSLESKRRWFMSKNQEAQAKAVEDDIKALAKKHSCSS